MKLMVIDFLHSLLTQLSKNDIMLGAVVFQISPQVLASISTVDATLGETGEVILAYLKGNGVQFLSERRFAQKNAKPLTIEINADMSHAIQHAVQGNSGQGETFDYRLEKVISVWRYSPKYNIGIVVKKDMVETMASVTSMQDINLRRYLCNRYSTNNIFVHGRSTLHTSNHQYGELNQCDCQWRY